MVVALLQRVEQQAAQGRAAQVATERPHLFLAHPYRMLAAEAAVLIAETQTRQAAQQGQAVAERAAPEVEPEMLLMERPTQAAVAVDAQRAAGQAAQAVQAL